MKAYEVDPVYNKTVLSNGVRVITEHHQYSRATTAGVFVDLGTRDEPEDLIGAAHFVEHMVFKGTKSRSSFEIAKSLEAVGGELNAYTTREYTCFHGTTLKEDTNLCLDVLSDIVSNAIMDSEEFEREKNVVLQEIDMSADQLEEYIFDKYFEDVYSGHNLGRSILGTPNSLAQISRKKLFDFYRERYRGENIVVAVAGHVNHDEIVETVDKKLGSRKSKVELARRKKPRLKKVRKVYKRPSEQAHILIGLPSTSYKDSSRFDAYVANAVLGGGMTSRVYQKIREKLGLAYSVYSYLHSYTDSGLLMLYAGTSLNQYGKVLDLLHKEFLKFREKGPTQKELKFYKQQVIGGIILGSDDIENRMNSLGVNEMVFNRYRPVDLVTQEIEKVTKESVMQYSEKYLDPSQLGISVMGDVDESLAQKLIESY